MRNILLVFNSYWPLDFFCFSNYWSNFKNPLWKTKKILNSASNNSDQDKIFKPYNFAYKKYAILKLIKMSAECNNHYLRYLKLVITIYDHNLYNYNTLNTFFVKQVLI